MYILFYKELLGPVFDLWPLILYDSSLWSARWQLKILYFRDKLISLSYPVMSNQNVIIIIFVNVNIFIITRTIQGLDNIILFNVNVA